MKREATIQQSDSQQEQHEKQYAIAIDHEVSRGDITRLDDGFSCVARPFCSLLELERLCPSDSGPIPLYTNVKRLDNAKEADLVRELVQYIPEEKEFLGLPVIVCKGTVDGIEAFRVYQNRPGAALLGVPVYTFYSGCFLPSDPDAECSAIKKAAELMSRA